MKQVNGVLGSILIALFLMVSSLALPVIGYLIDPKSGTDYIAGAMMGMASFLIVSVLFKIEFRWNYSEEKHLESEKK
jgi:prepilin signal peptidase PulO-like enzyme (type II secretory pathway)